MFCLRIYIKKTYVLSEDLYKEYFFKNFFNFFCYVIQGIFIFIIKKTSGSLMKYRLCVFNSLRGHFYNYIEGLKKIGAGMYFFGMLNLSSTYRKGKYGS